MITQLVAALSITGIYTALLSQIASISLPLIAIILASSLIATRLNIGWGVLHHISR